MGAGPDNGRHVTAAGPACATAGETDASVYIRSDLRGDDTD